MLSPGWRSGRVVAVRLAVASLAVMAAVIGDGCARSGPADGPPATTSGSDTTRPASTTAPTGAASSSRTVATTAAPPMDGPRPAPRPDGSGCVAAGDELADGLWFGSVDRAEPDRLWLDLACWYSGDAATAAAVEDEAESPPPNGFHIRDRSAHLRTIAVDGDAEVAWLPDPGDPAPLLTTDYGRWLAEGQESVIGGWWWLTVENGEIVTIRQQYVP